MTNTNIVLERSHLLAFLVNPSSNGFTEHYVSSQPLSLYIPYTEYVSLIQDLINLNLDILRTPISVYKSAMKCGETSIQMLKLFHYDIALASLEEVNRSYKRDFECTRIFGLVDCYSSLEVKTMRFDSSAEFIQANFTQQERKELHGFISGFKDIRISSLVQKKELVSNAYMYYVCMAFFGVYKLQKNFIISVEEE